jgi:hypothetical protein
MEVSRVQIPLMTAWVFTIHKCQGMMLHKVVLPMDRLRHLVALQKSRGNADCWVEMRKENNCINQEQRSIVSRING